MLVGDNICVETTFYMYLFTQACGGHRGWGPRTTCGDQFSPSITGSLGLNWGHQARWLSLSLALCFFSTFTMGNLPWNFLSLFTDNVFVFFAQKGNKRQWSLLDLAWEPVDLKLGSVSDYLASYLSVELICSSIKWCNKTYLTSPKRPWGVAKDTG